MTEFETRKLHITVPLSLYEFLRDNKQFKSIDGVIVQLLKEKYEIE